MSKKLNKSFGSVGGTPKNTLFNYFTKSPAALQKSSSKAPTTPSGTTDQKENTANECNSPKPTTAPRKLDEEFEKSQLEDNDEAVAATTQNNKRRRLAIVDTDSEEDEEAAAKDVKYNFDSDGDDEDFKIEHESSEDESSSGEESENASEISDESVSSEAETPKKKNAGKRKQTDKEPTAKKLKLELSNEQKPTVSLSALSVLSLKLDEPLEQSIDQDLINKDFDSKENEYDEPTVWPHQTIDFLQPDKIKDKKGRRPDHPDYDASTLFVPESFLNKQSPGVRQWWVLKSDNYDCVLFFKVGKFYELYHMDADVGVQELGFNYMRGEFAHSGFPEIAFEKMVSVLVDRGYKVARVEQTETPDMMAERCKVTKTTKFDKVVRREICQVINRGTQVFGAQCQVIENYKPNYMLAIAEKDEGATSRYGISFIDTSIGDFYVGEFADDKTCSRLLTLLSHHMPALVITEKSSLSERTQQIMRTMLVNVLKDQLPSNESNCCTAEKTLKHLGENYYAVSAQADNWPAALHAMQDPNDHLGLTPHADFTLALKAVGMCITYLQKCVLEEKVLPMARYNLYIPPDLEAAEQNNAQPIKSEMKLLRKHMVLDATTVLHLRIHGEEFSLISKLDSCCTMFGKRLLHYWVSAPSCECDVIRERQDAIAELVEEADLLQNMRAILKPLPDFERQLAQIHLFGNKIVAEKHPDGRAVLFEEKQYNKKKVQNFIALLEGFGSLQETIPDMFKNCKSALLRRLTQNPNSAGQNIESLGGVFPDMSEPLRFFATSFDHKQAAETGSVAPEKGLDEEYDETERKIAEIERELKNYLAEQEKFFGCRVNYYGTDRKRYQLEVPEKHAGKATSEYKLEGQRKGSNAVRRFVTEETKDFLKRMQKAEEERKIVVKDLSRRIFEKFSNNYTLWKSCVDCIAHLDVLGSLAEYAREQTVICKPVVLPATEKPYIYIQEGYHPCMPSDNYIPNSITFGRDDKAALSLLSGPNMGGKSTLMRQVGLLLVMAQIGSHVPAEACELTLVDRIFSRVGAQDDILTGQSTFMVEMNEASLILRHATLHSFVLMDELGRGTATYDGTAIAAAVVNFLANLGCRAMFSTHYKNLTDHFSKDKRVQLGHMACMVENEETDDPTEEMVTFLYKYADGACPKSYGFNAAKLAGMPHEIIKRAYELSKSVEAAALRSKVVHTILAAALEKPENRKPENSPEAIKNLLIQLRLCQL